MYVYLTPAPASFMQPLCCQYLCFVQTKKLYVVLTITFKTIAEINIWSKLESYNTILILVRLMYYNNPFFFQEKHYFIEFLLVLGLQDLAQASCNSRNPLQERKLIRKQRKPACLSFDQVIDIRASHFFKAKSRLVHLLRGVINFI